jgi:hypothetical protein
MSYFGKVGQYIYSNIDQPLLLEDSSEQLIYHSRRLNEYSKKNSD